MKIKLIYPLPELSGFWFFFSPYFNTRDNAFAFFSPLRFPYHHSLKA